MKISMLNMYTDLTVALLVLLDTITYVLKVFRLTEGGYIFGDWTNCLSLCLMKRLILYFI
jgi:hypothetical protein